MTKEATQLEDLVQTVLASPKYRAVSEDLVRNIGRRELTARRGFKEAVKATKNKLHQVAGAYLDARPPYEKWLKQLAAADQRLTTNDQRPMTNGEPGDERQETTDERQRSTDNLQSAIYNLQSAMDHGLRTIRFQDVCREIMAHHASTRERLGILDSFYATALAGIGPVRSVLDVACGLNPLTIPWMPLAADVTYYACDIYADMIAFLNSYFQVAGIRGQAQVCDLVTAPPSHQVDLALVLKVLPPLEQLDKSAGINLLRALRANHLLVSFPARTLGGRNKGMAESYEDRFRALAREEGWAIERFAFMTELVFLVKR